MTGRTRWVVELESGCWLAPWTGDPGRTLVLSSARRFSTPSKAQRALDLARDFRPFAGARILRAAAAVEGGEP